MSLIYLEEVFEVAENKNEGYSICRAKFMFLFTFSLQPFLHAKTTKVLETVLLQNILVVFSFLGAPK